MKVVRDGENENKIGDLNGQSLEKDCLGAGIVEVRDLHDRKRIPIRPTSSRRRSQQRAIVHTRTKQKREGNPTSIPKCATHYQSHSDCYLIVPL